MERSSKEKHASPRTTGKNKMTLESQREEKKAKGIDPCNLVTLREREKNDSRTGPGLRPLGRKEMRRRLTRLLKPKL
jgi:hypothetical protein